MFAPASVRADGTMVTVVWVEAAATEKVPRYGMVAPLVGPAPANSKRLMTKYSRPRALAGMSIDASFEKTSTLSSGLNW